MDGSLATRSHYFSSSQRRAPCDGKRGRLPCQYPRRTSRSLSGSMGLEMRLCMGGPAVQRSSRSPCCVATCSSYTPGHSNGQSPELQQLVLHLHDRRGSYHLSISRLDRSRCSKRLSGRRPLPVALSTKVQRGGSCWLPCGSSGLSHLKPRRTQHIPATSRQVSIARLDYLQRTLEHMLSKYRRMQPLWIDRTGLTRA